jgi:hypothetical protein
MSLCVIDPIDMLKIPALRCQCARNDPSPLNAAMLDETLAYSKELYDVGKAIFTGGNHFEVT